jgi:hypothetical protein
MFAYGKSPVETENALLSLRQWRLLESAGQSGVVYSSQSGKDADGPWLGDAGANIAQVPPQIAAKLEGREFRTFSAFIQAFWQAVADTPELAEQFSASNLARMRAGMPPLASLAEQYEEFTAFMIYHKIPVSDGGSLYDLSNMLIVTPYMYHTILDPKLQNMILNIMHSGHMSARMLLRRRREGRGRGRQRQQFGFGRWAKRKLRDLHRRYKAKRSQAGKALKTVPTVLIGQVLPPLWRGGQASRRTRRRPYPPMLNQTALKREIDEGGPAPRLE